MERRGMKVNYVVWLRDGVQMYNGGTVSIFVKGC